MIQQLDESLESRWYRKHSIKIHRQKLEDIKHRSKSTLKSSDHSLTVNLRKISQELDKQKKIDRENMILFIKLHQIRERKLNHEDLKGPKSLNFSVRKKEADRIINENYEFVKRFMEKPSFVSAKKLKQDYIQQLEYKRTISKANLHQRLIKLASFEGKPGQLPPLDTSLYENSSKLRSQVPSKLSITGNNDTEINYPSPGIQTESPKSISTNNKDPNAKSNDLQQSEILSPSKANKKKEEKLGIVYKNKSIAQQSPKKLVREDLHPKFHKKTELRVSPSVKNLENNIKSIKSQTKIDLNQEHTDPNIKSIDDKDTIIKNQEKIQNFTEKNMPIEEKSQNEDIPPKTSNNTAEINENIIPNPNYDSSPNYNPISEEIAEEV
jgi:Hemingway/CFA97